MGEEHRLVMPFVVVQSKDGPFEDLAYVCGWEAGVIYTELARASERTICATVHSSNIPQLDLVAMHHGFVMETDEYDDEWSHVMFSRSEPFP